jgi:hypothetical protein
VNLVDDKCYGATVLQWWWRRASRFAMSVDHKSLGPRRVRLYIVRAVSERSMFGASQHPTPHRSPWVRDDPECAPARTNVPVILFRFFSTAQQARQLVTSAISHSTIGQVKKNSSPLP